MARCTSRPLAGEKQLRRALALLLTGFLALPAAADEDARVAALEARIAQLETLVRKLLDDDAAQPAAPADVDSRVEAVAEQKVYALFAERDVAEAAAAEKDRFEIGGYVKVDAIYSDYDGGSVASNSPGRDFYIPGTVPVGGDGEAYFDLHSKETRLWVRSNHLLDSGDRLGAYVELDFLVGNMGDERISNSYSPRMRHAFFTWNKWLVGQTWHTFFNVGALPDNLDFVGPSESTVFGRQAMIRYTNGPWQFALENPETTITPFGGGARISANDGRVPDLVGRYNLSGDWGQLSVAALARQLRYVNNAEGIDSTTSGYGLSLSGKLAVGERDDFRWMVTAGKGLGRYVGLNTVNGAVLDANGELETIDQWSVFGSYRHLWSERWRSNFTLSYLDVENPLELTGEGVTAKAHSLHANLIYTPLPGLDIGFEYILGMRELESGTDGKLNRFQFSAKYAY